MLRRIKGIILFYLLILSSTIWSQELVRLEGKVIATDEVEGIHVLNKRSNSFTTTDSDGRFTILGKLNDTLVVSSIKYMPKSILIKGSQLEKQYLEIELVEMVNQLDQVVVGKVLTGDLGSDMENSESELPINFYDLGIPGYTGKRKTQAQRKLYAATSGSGLIPLIPIINAISGRTKRLKRNLKLETQNRYMDLAISKFSKLLFEDEVEKHVIVRFFYFASDNEEFLNLSKSNNDFKLLNFLIKKRDIYFEKLEQGEN